MTTFSHGYLAKYHDNAHSRSQVMRIQAKRTLYYTYLCTWQGRQHSHYGWFWTFMSLYYLYAKPVEMSCFTIQIMISTHDLSFKIFRHKYENWWIFALILLIGLAYESPICVLQFKPIIYEDIKNWYFGNKGTNRVQTMHSATGPKPAQISISVP